MLFRAVDDASREIARFVASGFRRLDGSEIPVLEDATKKGKVAEVDLMW